MGQQLRRRFRRTTRNARGHRQYDEELRVEIVEYVLRRNDDGYCQAEVTRELGLTQRTVRVPSVVVAADVVAASWELEPARRAAIDHLLQRADAEMAELFADSGERERQHRSIVSAGIGA